MSGRQQPARRVVIAEDEVLIRMDLREMLQELGFDVCGEAADGASAVELARRLQPDVVFLDIKMPGMDGLAAAEQIGAERIAPIVMLTAFSQPELVGRARDAGVMAYLVKPFQSKDLLPAVEIAVSRFAEARALESQLEHRDVQLAARKLIDRAKGMLQARHDLSEPAAFRWLQRAAMDQRRSMADVAQDVVDGRVAPT